MMISRCSWLLDSSSSLIEYLSTVNSHPQASKYRRRYTTTMPARGKRALSPTNDGLGPAFKRMHVDPDAMKVEDPDAMDVDDPDSDWDDLPENETTKQTIKETINKTFGIEYELLVELQHDEMKMSDDALDTDQVVHFRQYCEENYSMMYEDDGPDWRPTHGS